MTGLFPVTLTASTGLAGTASLQLRLTVNRVTGTLNGHAVQYIPSMPNNPTESAAVSGFYSELTVKGSPIIALHLEAKTSVRADIFHLSGVLEDWNSGLCTYSFYGQTISAAKLSSQPLARPMPHYADSLQ